MSSIISIILLIALGFAAFFMIRKMRAYKKPENTIVQDPASQAIYEKKNAKKDETLNLTLEERIDLSWQFLTDITEKIMNRFSDPDKSQIQQSGGLLAKNGAKYNHNIDQEISLSEKQVKSKAVTKDLDKSSERSR